MTTSIREQLLAKGFKESPRALVMRKWDELQQVRAALKGDRTVTIKIQSRSRLARREVELMTEIEEICKIRCIGNPVSGEAIEYVEQPVKVRK